ncbi:MAG: phage tail length tape measure family protein [Brevundimonas sp.]|uniref:phage tail length tape measure family protein n=1 Tax=Brevundimonas sp. TaxID=1871086 RepID=UPI00391DA2C5
MTDLASLGLRIESQQADKASAAMDKMAASADRAERATDTLSAGSAKADSAIAGMLASIDRTTKEMLELSRIHQQAGGAALVQAGATEKLTGELQQASTAGMLFRASFKAAQTDMGAATRGMNDFAASVGSGSRQIGANDAHMVAYRAHLKGVRSETSAATREGLNLSRQFADIGVTAAMGMNPLMIAIQQGPQLLDIFQEKAIRTGTTVRSAMLSTAVATRAAIAPLLPLVGALALAAGTVAASWGLASRAITKEIGSVTDGMGLNEKQLKKLKDENVATTATAGDAWRGLGTTIKEMFVSVFGDQLSWVDKQWNAFLDDLTKNTGKEVDAIAGFFVGAFNVVRDTWKLLPAALGDAAYSAAQGAVNAINWLIQKSVDGINSLRNQYNNLPAWMRGGQSAPTLVAPQLGGVANPYAGGMSAAASQARSSYGAGFESMQGASGRFMDTWRQNTRDSARSRIQDGAGDAGAERAAKAAKEAREVLQDFAKVDLDPIKVHIIQLVEPLQIVADEMRLIDQLAQDSAQGMASAFGETGRALGDLLTTMTSYQSRLAEIALAEKKKQIDGIQADRERAHAQVNYYGDTLAAAKSFFEEGSAGYTALQAAEAAWRVFSFAMSVQAMAQGAAETSAHVAQSGVKAGASTAAGAAKIFESLGPFGFPVVAAMIALLASLGMKGKGGGGGGSAPSLDGSVSKSQGYSQQADTVQNSFAASVAQKVEVKVTADRDGLNAYVAQTAGEVAGPMVAQGMAAASGATRAQVMSDLDKSRTYSRG